MLVRQTETVPESYVCPFQIYPLLLSSSCSSTALEPVASGLGTDLHNTEPQRGMLDSWVSFGYMQEAIRKIIYLREDCVSELSINGCDVICEAPDLDR
jgi:hypothetical protein